MRLIDSQFLKFLVVGVLNSLFGYGCYAFLLYCGLDYPIALFLATVIGVLFNFKTTGYLVFKSSNNKLIVRFISMYGIVYILNVLSLRVLESMAVNAYYGGAIMIAPMAVLTYILSKRFVFNNG